MEYIDLTPTPQGMVDSLLMVINNSTKQEDRQWAKEELIKAMKIAYAVWHGEEKPEYKLNI